MTCCPQTELCVTGGQPAFLLELKQFSAVRGC